jgi:hypothetical protein
MIMEQSSAEEISPLNGDVFVMQQVNFLLQK